MNYTYTQPVGRLRLPSARHLFGWLFAFLGAVAMASSAVAQTGTINGRVLNQGTGAYVKYAQVQIVGTDKTTLSESDGSFTLTNVPAGEVKLAVTYTGLDTAEVAVTVAAGATVTQDINLTTSDYGDVLKLTEFKVSSAREGNAKAIVEQRVALNLKTVVAADAFGDVSEGNVGEFLKLMPGVSVDYVDNDVRSTRIRGLPPKYTTTTIDGLPLANSGSNSLSVATGRQLELEQLSMSALDVLETTKSPTPDMMSANLAGNVNAISKSAFNQKGRSIKYSASVNFNQWFGSFAKSKGWDDENHSKALPGAKVEWIDTFFGGKLGMVLSAAHSGAFADQRVVIGNYLWDRDGYNNRAELPLQASWNFQDGLKPTWRDSILLNFDYKASEDLKLSLRTNYGYYRSEFYNRNWLAQANTAGLTTYDTDGHLITATTAGTINRAAGSGESLGSSTNSLVRVLGSNQRKSGGTLNVSPAASWKRDNIKVDIAGNYSVGKTAYTSGQDGYFSLVQADYQGVGFTYNRVAEDNVLITQTGTGARGSIFDLGNYNKAGSVEQTRRNATASMYSGKADVEIDYPDWSIPTTFKVGAANSLEVRDIHTLQAKWSMTLTSGATVLTGPLQAINLQDYRDPYAGNVGTVTDFNGVTAKTPGANKWALYKVFQDAGGGDPFALTANGPFLAQAANNLRNMLQNDVDINENISAAYAMATVKPIKKLSVVAGLRFEKTKTQGKGFDDRGVYQTLTALGIDTTTLVAGTTASTQASTAKVNAANSNKLDYIYYRYGSRVTREKNYDNVLPMVQARYEINRNFIGRVAYYGSILRPDFQNVVGGVSATDNNDGSYAFSINNSTVKPETADNFDVSIEYYFEPVGVVSAAFFYKDIKNIQISVPKSNYSGAPADIKDQIASAGYSATELAYSGNTYTTTINGPKTSLWGFELAYSQELSFLPSAFKGLGVTANFSHYAPKEKRLWALVPNAGDGMALDQGNLILRYKVGKFKAQITGTWTDKRLQGNALTGLVLKSDGTFEVPPPTGTSASGLANQTNANTTAYQGARWVFSPSAEYEINRYATVFASVNNILNSAKYNYQEQNIYTTRNGNYGAAINVGVKGSF